MDGIGLLFGTCVVIDPCKITNLVVLVLLEEHLPEEGAERRDTRTRREL